MTCCLLQNLSRTLMLHRLHTPDASTPLGGCVPSPQRPGTPPPRDWTAKPDLFPQPDRLRNCFSEAAAEKPGGAWKRPELSSLERPFGFPPPPLPDRLGWRLRVFGRGAPSVGRSKAGAPSRWCLGRAAHDPFTCWFKVHSKRLPTSSCFSTSFTASFGDLSGSLPIEHC